MNLASHEPKPPLPEQIRQGHFNALARALSYVENEVRGYRELLESLPFSNRPVIGITGPPGAGKSTLLNAMIGQLLAGHKKLGILCVDPSSPFTRGALLGDRIRMSEWYTHPDVFIRSVATRGGLGGLSPKIIEMTELMKTAPFDHIIIETAGVGQNEIEIAGLADTTVVVMVPEGGDEIQTMKAGLMEIADIFVVNKADRPGADLFIKNIRSTFAPVFHEGREEIPVVKTIASRQEGIAPLLEEITRHESRLEGSDRKITLLTEKAYQLIQQDRMKDISKERLYPLVKTMIEEGNFNLYKLIGML
ncbi:MAG: methylmalonyl Co-A mutase-associated GTPase MeaB [Puia sp.]|nr:methylmalonyl Co-A mutase-associated GTPase MeaB [Puia sp.]